MESLEKDLLEIASQIDPYPATYQSGYDVSTPIPDARASGGQITRMSEDFIRVYMGEPLDSPDETTLTDT